MDGVLCDFTGGCCKIFNIQPWDIVNYSFEKYLGITEEDFWKRIDDTKNFWETLEPTPWFQDLMSVIKALDVEWYIASAPCLSPKSAAGKMVWMQERFGREFDRYFFTPHKSLLAAKNRILIDDRDKNIDDWNDAGGYGIVMPQPWNRLRDWFFLGDGMDYVESALELFTGRRVRVSNTTRRDDLLHEVRN